LSFDMNSKIDSCGRELKTPCPWKEAGGFLSKQN